MNRKRCQNIFVITVSLAFIATAVIAENKPSPSDVVALVGGAPIKYTAIMIPEEYSKNLSKEEIIQKEKKQLATVIFYRILLAEAKERGIEVTQNELEQEADELIKNMTADPDFAKEMAAAREMDPSAPKTIEEIRSQYVNSADRINEIRIAKLKKYLGKDVVVTKKEISDEVALLEKTTPKPKGSEVKIYTFWNKDKDVIEKIKHAIKNGTTLDEIGIKFKLYPDQGGGNRSQVLKWSKDLSPEYAELFYLDTGTQLPIEQIKKDNEEFYQLRVISYISGEPPIEPKEDIEKIAEEKVLTEKQKQAYKALIKKWLDKDKFIEFCEQPYCLENEDFEPIIQ